MQIEKENTERTPSPLQTRFDSTTELLTDFMVKKDPALATKLTAEVKLLYCELNMNDFKDLLASEGSQFGSEIRNFLADSDHILPDYKTNNEIMMVVLLALLCYKRNQFRVAREILYSHLFERPHLFSHISNLDRLNDYLFYKYLNCIEFEEKFGENKRLLFELLKEFQISKKELLFCNLYTFIMRNLLFTNQMRELGLLLKNCFFPEQFQFLHYSKYLFYKGVFLGRINKFIPAYKYIGEAFRKLPQVEDGKSQKGLERFVLLVRKQKIVLELLMNNLPNPETFLEQSQLETYKTLVKMVSNGYTQQFHDLVRREKDLFENDLVMPLLKKLHSIVLRNALKKLSCAYTKISVKDILEKIHADKDPNFDLQSFLVKSKENVENFQIDPKNSVVNFAKTKEEYHDESIRANLLKRIKHLNSLEEQVIKSLKYPEKKTENVEKKGEDEDKTDELDWSIEEEDF